MKRSEETKESKIIDLTDNSSPTAGPSTLRSRAALIQSPSDSNEDVSQLTGVTQVAHFLNACFPPMAHFYQHFIDFGCTGEEHLFAVSTWSSEEISQFLSKVSAHGSDELNSRTWICSFYTTISSLISPRLRLDCIKVQCMINCKKQKKGGLDCISLLKFLLSCCVVFLNALYLALYLSP